MHCTPEQCVKYLQEPSHCHPFHIICAAHLHSVLNICRNQQLHIYIYIIYTSHAVEWTGEGRNRRGQFYGRRWFQDIACPDAFGSDGAKREDLLCTHTHWRSQPCRCATPRYPTYSWNKHTETWSLVCYPLIMSKTPEWLIKPQMVIVTPLKKKGGVGGGYETSSRLHTHTHTHTHKEREKESLVSFTRS